MTSEDSRQRFFFLHLQKTGGTTMLRRLQEHFAPEQIYPADGDGPGMLRILDVNHLLEVWERRREEIVVVTGHFPFATMELLGEDFSTFTLLREPVERTLSFLRHQRKVDPRWTDSSLEEIYADQPLFDALVQNHMTKMLALDAETARHAGPLAAQVLTQEHLTLALTRLASIDVVGCQEHFEPFCRTLEARFGWDLREPRYSNRTEPGAVSPSFIERIAADNALDVQLYAAAADRFPI